jgi:hypothetical protein
MTLKVESLVCSECKQMSQYFHIQNKFPLLCSFTPDTVLQGSNRRRGNCHGLQANFLITTLQEAFVKQFITDGLWSPHLNLCSYCLWEISKHIHVSNPHSFQVLKSHTQKIAGNILRQECTKVSINIFMCDAYLKKKEFRALILFYKI